MESFWVHHYYACALGKLYKSLDNHKYMYVFDSEVCCFYLMCLADKHLAYQLADRVRKAKLDFLTT